VFRRNWPSFGWLVQLGASFPGEGPGEVDGIAAGLTDVGVVQEPVDGRHGQEPYVVDLCGYPHRIDLCRARDYAEVAAILAGVQGSVRSESA